MKLLYGITTSWKKQLLWGLAVCLILTLTIYHQRQTTSLPEDIVSARTLTIGAQEGSQGYVYAGEVRGRYESQLAFQVSGKIIKRNVDLGSQTHAGDVLMQIDAKDFQQAVNSRSAQVTSAESQLSLAESNLNRYSQLLKQGGISQAMYDQYVNAYQVANADVRQASAQYAQVANQLDNSLLVADKSGVVAMIAGETGQVISAGQTVLTIVQDGDREVEISIPENRVETLRNAGSIQVTFWALPQVTLVGKIREIAPMADPATRTFKIRIQLLDPPPEIKLGMTASVRLTDGRAEPAVYIPLSAVYQDGDRPSVWLVTDNSLTLQPITTGKFGNGTIEAVSGLKAGDCIVISGVHKLKNGQTVKAGGERL